MCEDVNTSEPFLSVCVFLRLELEKLTSRIHNLESEIRPEQAEATPPYAPRSEGSSLNTQAALKTEEEREAAGRGEELSTAGAKRDTAASVIQRRWREHRERVGDCPPRQTELRSN